MLKLNVLNPCCNGQNGQISTDFKTGDSLQSIVTFMEILWFKDALKIPLLFCLHPLIVHSP